VRARTASTAEPGLAGSVRIGLALARLNVLGSVLMIGAHPDDENTPVLVYLTLGRGARVGYLSLTRGEGGQNLLGPEQGELLGLIRTQELLAARRIDAAEQYFTRAIDFGYTKSSADTLSRWGHDTVLADLVWVIRRFRPDVVVQVFTGTPSDGHAQHQASGILATEAFAAAAGRARFPDQLRWVEPWQAKRLMQGGFRSAGGPGVELNIGEFDPRLGFSYLEIAGMSRSMHRSQGMGAPEWRGAGTGRLKFLAGEPAEQDIFEGIDITWSRVPGGGRVGEILGQAARQFTPDRPENSIPLLLQARPLVAAIQDPWADLKLHELDETVAMCAGLWLDATSEKATAFPGGSLKISVEAVNRSRFPLTLRNVRLEGMPGLPAADTTASALPYNLVVRRSFTVAVPEDQPYSQPYYLERAHGPNVYDVPDQERIGEAESPAPLRARFRIEAGSEEIEIVRPVVQRYVDRLEGETTRTLVVAPPLSIRISEPVLLFPSLEARTVAVLVKGVAGAASGELRLEAPPGWRIQPASQPFAVENADEETTLWFRLNPPGGQTTSVLRAVATNNAREYSTEVDVMRYPDLAPQTAFLSATARLVRAGVRTAARQIGYVMGAGDQVPRALRQMGCEVTSLGSNEMAQGDLSRLDAIVTGVRAFNVRADLRASLPRLLEYVEAGGTLLVQYNVADGRSPETVARVGPYPLKLGRTRVTAPSAPVARLDPEHPLLTTPNRINERDFSGWIQERGLYFATEWDPRYQPLFECHDAGEQPSEGATLYAPHGKGAYVFTALSWFRQLPGGVPGAFRIFANLLSAGMAARR
jgi:LmbE family N-acetylglucosaminyl deacetylase